MCRWAGHETPTLFLLAVFGSFISYIYSAPPLKLKQSGWYGNYALGSSYIALPWLAGQVRGSAHRLRFVPVHGKSVAIPATLPEHASAGCHAGRETGCAAAASEARVLQVLWAHREVQPWRPGAEALMAARSKSDRHERHQENKELPF